MFTQNQVYGVYICDDEQFFTEELANDIEQCMPRGDIPYEIHKLNDPHALLDVDARSINLLFLDVSMPEMEGFEAAKILRQRNRSMQIVFLTFHKDRIAEGYPVGAFDYLIKPYTQEGIEHTLKRAMKDYLQYSGMVLLNLDTYAHEAIPTNRILYFRAKGDYTYVHTIDRQIRVGKTLRNLELTLNGQFMRVHRSYIVNVGLCTGFGPEGAKMANGEVLPISGRRYTDYKEEWFESLIAHADFDIA